MEFDKDKLEQDWQDRFAREHRNVSLIEGYKGAKQKALDKAEPDSVEYWQLGIEIFDLETNIQVKLHYIESMRKDKAQQEWWLGQYMEFCKNHYLDVLKKVRVCIDRKTDKASVLEVLTKEMPQRETPEWYARIWEINEHVNAAKVPTTEQLKAVK